MSLEGREVLVIGLGLSGRSAARYCAAEGARVTATDERPADELGPLDEIPRGVRLQLGEALPDPAAFDLVVPSPGVPRERYADRARAVAGDIELAGRALSVPIVAVTGTNGKSTTVRLCEAMLGACGLRARAGGNVGTPALSLLGAALDVAVLEVSSFQLEAVESFRPRVAVVLNVTPDHLDRHGDVDTYAATKRRLLERQEPGDAAVLNVGDPRVAAMVEATRARVIPFRLGPPPVGGLGSDGEAALWARAEGAVRIPLEGFPLAGVHNRENLLAALGVVVALELDPGRAVRALPSFRGLPHRCEIVTERGGVRFVNDSKATNPGAAQRSLESFDAPLLWIVGGRDKNLDFAALADVAAGRVRAAFLIGEAAAALREALADRVNCHDAPDLAAAVRAASDAAKAGDVVLLAPACASFDQFESFEERGDVFRECVLAGAEGGAR